MVKVRYVVRIDPDGVFFHFTAWLYGSMSGTLEKQAVEYSVINNVRQSVRSVNWDSISGGQLSETHSQVKRRSFFQFLFIPGEKINTIGRNKKLSLVLARFISIEKIKPVKKFHKYSSLLSGLTFNIQQSD
jgi:hypothetical protein